MMPDTPEQKYNSECRHFLSFAAQRAAAEDGGEALVIWTQADHRGLRATALGLYDADTDTTRGATFGAVPTALVERFMKDPMADSRALLRIELSAAEVEEPQRVWRSWEKRSRTGMLLYALPHLNLLVFLTRLVASLNRHGERLRAPKLDWSVADELASRYNLPQIPWHYIQALKRFNQAQHITDRMLFDGRRSRLAEPLR